MPPAFAQFRSSDTTKRAGTRDVSVLEVRRESGGFRTHIDPGSRRTRPLPHLRFARWSPSPRYAGEDPQRYTYS